MTLHSPDPMDNRRDVSSWIRYAFVAVAILIGVATVVGLVAAGILIVFPRTWPSGLEVVALAGLLIVGLTSGGLVLAAAIVYRLATRLLSQATAIDQQTAIMAEQSLARTQADTYAHSTAVDPVELRDLLKDIHEALLLPEEERSQRFQKLMQREFADRLAAADQFVDSGDFHRAREELAALVERFGNDSRIQQARERLEKASEAARADSIAQASRRIEDLMGLTHWDEAERTALELAEQYPLANEPATLLERVRRERKMFEQQHRRRMHEEIQQLVHQRRWCEALAATRQFIQTFPTGPDTDALHAQMETLEANADIQTRQMFERHIRRYIQEEQYWDALALARRIISEYPLSPQANVLRAQLPRLEELARKQGPQK